MVRISTTLDFRRKTALAGIVGIALALTMAVIVYAYHSTSYSGTVGGVSWTAFDSIDHRTGDGGYIYNGVSKTTAAQLMTVSVSTSGRELCGPLVIDTDWSSSKTLNNSAGITIFPPSGWAQAGQCAWYIWQPKTVVSNYAYHQVVNGSDHASKYLDVWELLPN